MKVKFNLFERVAGLFVAGAVMAAIGATVGIGLKKGWFEQKIPLKTYVENADGIRPGTMVQLAGLQIGSVDNVELKMGNRVEIYFSIRKSFIEQIRRDSKVRITRPFIIGEKVLEMVPGSKTAQVVRKDQIMIAEYAPDFLEIFGGNKLGLYFESLNSTMTNIQKLAEAFFSDKRTDQIIALFDQMEPLITQMNKMAREVGTLSATMNKDNKIEKAMTQFIFMSDQMNKTLPQISKDIPNLTKNLNKLTADLNEMIPIFKSVAPEFPEFSKKMINALNETVLTLKAAQKTWFLRSRVEEVKEQEKKRQPAEKDN